MAKKDQLIELLARELGYKDSKKLKSKLEDNKQRKETTATGGAISRLESGQGFGEAFAGAAKENIKEVGEAFSAKGVKSFGKKAYLELFKGNDVISAYMRGRLAKTPKKLDESQEEEQKEEQKSEGLGGDSNSFLKIIAKESMSLPGIARDTNVLRQNLQKLVTLMGGKKATGADAHFLKAGERAEKLRVETEKEQKYNTSIEVESETERAKDISFFEKEDAKEAEKEKKEAGPTVITQQADGKQKETGGLFGNLLNSVIDFLKNGLLSALKLIFNPKMLLKLLGKIFVIGTILVSLFKGITSAFDRWKKTGSLKEAIIAGLGSIVDFITFGFFGEESIRKVFDKIGDFMDPVIETVSSVIDDVKNWIANNVGIPKISVSVPEMFQKLGAPKEFSIGPYYPFKSSGQTDAVGKNGSMGSPGAAGTKGKDGSSAALPKPPKSEFLENPENKIYVEQAKKELATSGKIISPQKLESRARELKQIDEAKQSSGPTAVSVTAGETESYSSPSKVNTDQSQQSSGVETSPTSMVLPGNAGSSGTAGASGVDGSSGTAGASGVDGSSGTAGASGITPSLSSGSAASLEPATSSMGSTLSSASTEIAEKQRMEMSADAGSMVNNSTVNNSQQSQNEGKQKPADAYDSDFVNLYATT